MTHLQNLDLFSLSKHDSNTWWNEICNKLSISKVSGWPDQFGAALTQWSSERNISIKTLSLFSGGGGLDIGFADVGFEIIEQVEIDARFAQTLENNKALHHAKVNCIDIRAYNPPENLVVDMIIGGPPCQTFSAAGRRSAGVKGTTDPRGTLFQEYVRILNKLRPKAFLFENVAGILGAEKGEAWKAIIEAFKEVGYTIHWKLLDAADFGVPQHRERVFIVGVRDAGNFRFPKPTHGPDAKSEYYTARQATDNVELHENVKKLSIKGRWSHLLPDIPPGLNYSYFTSEMGYPKPIFAWRSKFSDFLYKADPETPVRTIKAQGGQYTGPFSWENRHFDVTELKRLQTFPDNYVLDGKRNVQIHQIGNSVPPQIGRVLALAVLDQIFGIVPPTAISYLEENEELNFRKRKRELTKHYANKAAQAINNLNLEKDHRVYVPEPKVLYLDKNLSIGKENSQNSLRGEIDYSFEYDQLKINIVFEKTEKDDQLILNISKNELVKSDLATPFSNIQIISNGNSINHFSFLWKVLEEYLFSNYGVDDLVQFSGYYQYIPKIKASLCCSIKKPLWDVVSKIVSGDFVNVQMNINSMSKHYEVEEKTLLEILKELKLFGYEIRNHNTNPQIPKDEYLIPYIFPSMNNRSLQRFKDL